MGKSLRPHSGTWPPTPSTLGTPRGPGFSACTSGSAWNTGTFLPAASQPCACRAASKNLQPTFFSFPASWHGCGIRCLCSGEGGLCKQVFTLLALVSPRMNQGHPAATHTPATSIAPATITGAVPAVAMKAEAWGAVSWDICYRCFPRMRSEELQAATAGTPGQCHILPGDAREWEHMEMWYYQRDLRL